MKQMLLVVAGLMFFVSTSYALEANPDFKVKDLRGEVGIDFTDIKLKPRALRADFSKILKKDELKLECWVLIDAKDKSIDSQSLNRRVKYAADKITHASGSERFVVFQGNPSLHCWVFDLKAGKYSPEATQNLTVGQIQSAFGHDEKGNSRASIHYGSGNLAEIKRAQDAALAIHHAQRSGKLPTLRQTRINHY